MAFSDSLVPGLNPVTVFDGLLFVGGTLCTQRQWREALLADGYLQAWANAVPASVLDPIRIQYDCGMFVAAGDALWTFTQSTLGLSTAQMSALLATALALPL